MNTIYHLRLSEVGDCTNYSRKGIFSKSFSSELIALEAAVDYTKKRLYDLILFLNCADDEDLNRKVRTLTEIYNGPQVISFKALNELIEKVHGILNTFDNFGIEALLNEGPFEPFFFEDQYTELGALVWICTENTINEMYESPNKDREYPDKIIEF